MNHKNIRLSYFKKSNDGNLFLYLPGGFGISSTYMKDIAKMLTFGTHIGVDIQYFPELSKYNEWGNLLKSVLRSLTQDYNSITIIAHSCGGMLYLSSKFKSRKKLKVILISTPLDNQWIISSSRLEIEKPIPESLVCADRYNSNPTNKNLQKLFVSWSEYYFINKITNGKNLLKKQIYNSKIFMAGNRYFNSRYKNRDENFKSYYYIHGASDCVIPAKLLSKNIKNLYLIPNSGHFPWVDNKNIFKSCLKRCIRAEANGGYSE